MESAVRKETKDDILMDHNRNIFRKTLADYDVKLYL